MTCDEIRDNLPAYLDGEIDGAPRRAMDAHFATCPPCAAERRAQAAAWALLDRDAVPEAAAPAGPGADAAFRARLRERLAATPATAGPGRILRFALPAAAAAALVAIALDRAGAPPPTSGGAAAVALSGADAPPAELLASLGLLESLDDLEDEDLALLEALAEIDPDDLAVLGG